MLSRYSCGCKELLQSLLSLNICICIEQPHGNVRVPPIFVSEYITSLHHTVLHLATEFLILDVVDLQLGLYGTSLFHYRGRKIILSAFEYYLYSGGYFWCRMCSLFNIVFAAACLIDSLCACCF